MPRRSGLPEPLSSASSEWPRWEVLKQDAPGKPHQMVGSVHAGDAEQALLNARHVFVRRPSAVSLWVAPAAAFAHATPEGGFPEPGDEPGGEREYLVFAKSSHRRTMVYGDHVGAVTAGSAAAALALARAAHQGALALWVLPEAELLRSDDDPGTVASWFEPAKEKTYRQQSAYGVVGRHVSAHRRPERKSGRKEGGA